MIIINSKKEVMEIEFAIMKYIKKVCEENNLTYFLGGGTLLGAIRHNGFIPWDDDIDLMLPRNDYKKLINIINNDNSKFYVMTYKDKKYYYPFARVIDTKTILKESSNIDIKGMGIYVDLFPIDGLPKQKIYINIIFNFMYKYWIFFNSYINLDGKNIENKLYINIKIFFIRKINCIINFLLSNLSFENSKYVACVIGIYGKKEIVPKKVMQKGKKVYFEGEYFIAPKGYKIYLKRHYGDYMKLPPKSKQKTNHSYLAWYKE